MKKLLIAILIILLVIPLIACAKPIPQPVPDIPRYTVDQVVKAVETYAPSTRLEKNHYWKTIYQGYGIWRVERISAHSIVYQFNELTGEVKILSQVY